MIYCSNRPLYVLIYINIILLCGILLNEYLFDKQGLIKIFLLKTRIRCGIGHQRSIMVLMLSITDNSASPLGIYVICYVLFTYLENISTYFYLWLCVADQYNARYYMRIYGSASLLLGITQYIY